jgi:patatin-like phospholipase/acyl hydrolase
MEELAHMKKILSIDGGGIRGICPAHFLAALEAKIGPCYKNFDLIAGTSTGGILAVGLTKPGADRTKAAYSAADLVGLYQQKGHEIFSHSVAYELENGFGATGPKYPATGIEAVLSQYFGDTELGASLTNTFLTSYDMQAPGPRFFKSWQDKTVRMADAARATSAAPVYFPSHPLNGELLIDGGVVANNPSMCAWVASSEIFQNDHDVLVVSLGTGNSEKKMDPVNWGLVQWAPALIDIFMDGNGDSVHEEIAEVVGATRYFRFQFDLGSTSSAMDDTSTGMLNSLLSLADKMVVDSASQIDTLVKLIKT